MDIKTEEDRKEAITETLRRYSSGKISSEEAQETIKKATSTYLVNRTTSLLLGISIGFLLANVVRVLLLL